MRKKMLALLLCGIMAASPAPVLAGSKKRRKTGTAERFRKE